MTGLNAKRLPERFLAAVQAGEPKAMQTIAQELSFSRDRCLADGTPLVCAVAGTGNIEAMQILLARRYVLITHDPRIPSPVQVAVRSGHLPMLEFLLAKGEHLFPPLRVHKTEDPYKPGPVGLPPIRKSDIVWEAFQSGNPAMLAFVVARLGPVGPDWFVADAQGCQPLHHVLSALLEGDPRGTSDTVRRLAEAGASLFHLNRANQTPVGLAFQANRLELVDLLVAGAAQFLKESLPEQSQAFLAAATQDDHAAEILQRAFTAGVTVSEDSLWAALRNSRSDAVVRLLIDRWQTGGAEVPKTLDLARFCNSTDDVFELLLPLADVVHVPEYASSALHHSCEMGNLRRVKALLAARAPVNRHDRWKKDFPIHLALKAGNREIVARLMAAGADPAISNSSEVRRMAAGEEPARSASSKRSAPELDSAPSPCIPGPRVVGSFDWFSAVTEGNLPKMARLFQEGEPVDAVDDAGRTAMHIAAANGDLGGLDLLYSLGAGVDVTLANDTEDGLFAGSTPLFAAARFGKGEAIRWLREHLASSMILDRQGRTALDAAIGHGKPAWEALLDRSLGGSLPSLVRPAPDGETVWSRVEKAGDTDGLDVLSWAILPDWDSEMDMAYKLPASCCTICQSPYPHGEYTIVKLNGDDGLRWVWERGCVSCGIDVCSNTSHSRQNSCAAQWMEQSVAGMFVKKICRRCLLAGRLSEEVRSRLKPWDIWRLVRSGAAG